MKKIFSFLVIFSISLLGIFGSYNLVNNNLKIDNGNTGLVNTSQKEVSYPTEDSYLEKGDSATLEGWNVDVQIFKAKITFNNFEITGSEISYYLTVDVTSFYYNDLIGFLYLYNAEDNSQIDHRITMFEGYGVENGETKSTDVVVSAPVQTQVKIKFWFGPRSNWQYAVYTSTSAYLMIDDALKPIINSFGVNESNTTTNSINVSWDINDTYNIIDSMKMWVWDGKKLVMSKQIDSTMLIGSNYVIDGLNSNTNYTLELEVHWSENISSVSGTNGVVKQTISVNTNAQVPTIGDFSLVEITSDGVILSIKYDDPDKVVNSITISDENGNMTDITISPDDIVNDTYEIDIPQNGDYKLNITLNWTSLDGNGVVQANQQNQVVEFTFSNHVEEYNYNSYYMLIPFFMVLIIWILLMILLTKWNNAEKITMK